jgi:MerR family mercuric resistance operon transcriptional regulator
VSEPCTSFTIGQLAAVADVNVETIRYYQRRGLLSEPPRPSGSVRRYGAADADRIRFVKSAQRLGFALDDVAELLRLEDGAGCSDARRLAQRKLDEVRVRLAELSRIEAVLTDLVRRCGRSRGRVACPLIRAMHDTPGRDRPAQA